MGKSSGTKTASNDPWGPAQASLRLGLSEANRIYGAMSGNPGTQTPMNQMNPMSSFGSGALPFSVRSGSYNGDPRSGSTQFTPFQQNQQNQQSPTMQTSFDPSQVSGYNLWGPAEEEMMRTISGDYLDGSNPYLDAVIGRARAGVNSNFAGMSRYGSGSHIDQVMTQAEAPIRYQDYSNERARQERAIGGLSGFTQGYANAPYADLNAFLGTVSPIAGRGSQQTQPTSNNPLAGAAGGALAGAALAPAGASFLGSAATAGAAAVPAMWPYLLGGALLGGFAS